MMKKIDWKNPYVVGLIIPLILFLISQFIPIVRKFVWVGIKWFFTNDITIPLWLFILFTAVVLIFIVLIIRQWFLSLNTPDFLDYNSDVFFNLYWKWEYEKDYKGKYDIINLHVYCPNCDIPLSSPECVVCDYVIPIPENPIDNIEGNVKNIIKVNIRKEKFKE